MNQLVSIDSILEPTTALAPATLFGSGQVETILAAIEKYVRAEVFDIATAEGRERIKSSAYKIARSKTTLDEIGKEHVAEIKKQSAAIDAERRTIRERLDALKDEVRGPLTAWEEAEANRISGHEAALVTILSEMHAMATPRQLREHKADLEELAGRDWQEFGDRAVAAFNEAMPKLVARIEAAEQRERDQAELEALRKEKAEREARDERERNQRIADELRATQARIEAERERERAEQRERDRQAAEERAKKQAEEAAARA